MYCRTRGVASSGTPTLSGEKIHRFQICFTSKNEQSVEIPKGKREVQRALMINIQQRTRDLHFTEINSSSGP